MLASSDGMWLTCEQISASRSSIDNGVTTGGVDEGESIDADEVLAFFGMLMGTDVYDGLVT